MPGMITVSGSLPGLDGGVSEAFGPFNTPIPMPVGEILSQELAAGDNLFPIPPNTLCVFVQLPAGNTSQVILKRAVGDTDGFELALTGNVKIDINPSLCTALVLNAAAATTANVFIVFA